VLVEEAALCGVPLPITMEVEEEEVSVALELLERLQEHKLKGELESMLQ